MDLLYQNAFNETVDGIIISEGSTGEIVDVNKSCCDLFNCNKSELINSKISELFLDNNADLSTIDTSDINMYGSVLPSKKIKTSSGKHLTVDVTINTFSAGDKNYIMTTLRDANEREEYEKKILTVNEELTRANNSKDKLFSIIAHDLKNPMMALMGFSEFLTEDDISPEEVFQFGKSINNLSKNTYDLLDNLLTWAQVQTQKIEFEKRKFNINDVVEKTFSLLKPAADLKNIKLVNEIIGNPEILADQNMIQTVIRNFVSNSIKFSNENTLITLKVLFSQAKTQIVIEDQGIGMSEETIKSLYNSDLHSTSSGTNNEKGTGLGIAICYEFIKKHNGELHIESELKKGSKFYITLPA